MSLEAIVKNIRTVGVRSTVRRTDFGQAKNMHPVFAMQEYLQGLRQAGFTEKEIESMVVNTPKALLGI